MVWRRYTINESFFEKWTSDSAYVYGWIVGDGHVCMRRKANGSIRKCLHLNGSLEEEELLRRMLTAMGSNHPITRTGGGNCLQAQVGSEKLVDQMVRCGLHQHLVIDLCENRGHFLRGYFDADGGVALVREKCRFYLSSVVYDNLIRVQQQLLEEGVASAVYESKPNRLQVSTPAASRMFELLYGNGGMRHERKYQFAAKCCHLSQIGPVDEGGGLQNRRT